MNWTVIIIETLVMTAAFTAMILIPLVKNPVWWIHDYPKDIQEEYFKTHERVPADFFSPTVLLKKGLALLFVLAVLLGLLKLAGVEGFKAYHQKRYHFVQSLWGMLIGLIPCLAGAGLYAWLF